MTLALVRGGIAATFTLILALGAPVMAAESTPGPLDQSVSADEQSGKDKVVIKAGHVDLGPRFVDGAWRLRLRDDTKAPPVWRSLGDVVLQLPGTAILPAPDDEQFSFLDAKAGQDVYVVPQTENADVVWVGWNSQDPEVVRRLAGGLTLRLHGVDGPGQFVLFLQNGNFDPAQLLWTSAKSEPQDIWAESNTHVHGNWVFTAPGTYLLDVEIRAELKDGTTVTDRTLLRFAVGDETDPQQAFAAAAESVAPTTTPTSARSDQAASPARTESGISGAVLIGGVAALVVVAAVVYGALRSRRARRLAETEQ